jgi:hypothetical protein
MAYEHLKNSTLPRTLSEVLADLADLVQKEIRLARAEISAKLTTKIQGGVWLGAAAFLGLIAALQLVYAVVYGIASFGIALHWSYLIVAVVLGILAAGAFMKGRSDLAEDLVPGRAIHNVKQDISTAREQLT